MRRRAYLASLAAVGFTSGCLGGGPGPTVTPTADPGDQGSTPTPTPSPSPPPTETPTSTDSPTPTVSIAPIDEPALESAVLEAAFASLGFSINHQGTLVEKLDEMAGYHSDQMAETRTVAHELDGETTVDRYEKFDLNCRVRDNEGDSLLGPEHLEVVGAVSTRGKTVEGAAQELVDGWLADPEDRERLLRENADHVGIGATIVTGKAYVTIVYC